MTPEELRAALNETTPADVSAGVALARRVRAELLALPAEAARLAAGSPGVAPKARVLTGRLEELAAGVLLDADRPVDPETEIWMVATAVAATVSLRARAVARVQQLLGDRRLVTSPPADPRLEEPVRPRRVCDAAYVMLRELLSAGESREAFVMDRWAFERLPESERDAEIGRVQGGAAFARFLADREA